MLRSAMTWLIGQPSQNGPRTVHLVRSGVPSMTKAPLVVPTSTDVPLPVLMLGLLVLLSLLVLLVLLVVSGSLSGMGISLRAWSSLRPVTPARNRCRAQGRGSDRTIPRQ